MRERLKKKNNIIIGSLLAVVFLMAVGYAAFATNLNIGTTSNITSTWNILITNISSTETGTATDTTTNKTPNSLTANISAELQSPGDKVTYQITVANNGSLDAKLESLTMTESSNDAILITKSGINQGSVLEANDTAVLTVVMEYNPEVTEQPSSTTASTTITFNYVQSSSEYANTLYTVEYWSDSWRTGETSNTSQSKIYEKTVHYDEQGLNLSLEDVNLQRIGYEFKGWYNYINGGGGEVNNFVSYNELLTDGSTQNSKIVYAYWTVRKFNIIYDTQGGNHINSVKYNWTSKNIVKTTPTRGTGSGYAFAGWYTEPNGQGINVTSSTYVYQAMNYDDSNDSITLYANWHEKEYTLIYDSDGGSAVASRTVNWWTDHLNTPTPTKNGYTFDGWYSGSRKITDSTKYSDFASSAVDGSSMTITAHWIQN